MEIDMKQKEVVRRYMRELVLSFALYTLLLVASIKFGRPMPESSLRTAILLSPMLGFLGAIWAIARHLNGIDEYQRKFVLDTWAIAAALTAALTFSYGFLETAGFPKLSMFTVWMVMGSAWAIVCLARSLMRR
jgi:hypothetical protein